MAWMDTLKSGVDAARVMNITREINQKIDWIKEVGLPEAANIDAEFQALKPRNAIVLKDFLLSRIEPLAQHASAVHEAKRLEAERAEKERRIAAQKVERERRVERCLAALNNQGAQLEVSCEWVAENLDRSQKDALVNEVTGWKNQIQNLNYLPGRDAFSVGSAMIGNAMKGYNNGKIGANILSAGNLLSQTYCFRPVSNFEEIEMRLLQAVIFMYGDTFIDDNTFDRIWFGFIWAGGTKGRVGIKQSDNQLAVVAQQAMTLYLKNRHFDDYDLFLSTVKSMVADATQEGSPNLKKHLGSVLDAGNRWSYNSDFLKTRLLSNNFQTGLVLCGSEGEPVCYQGPGALLTIAPPRTGKSAAQVITSLMTYTGSCVVLDVKGELFEATARRRLNMGQRLIRWNPLDRSGTHRFDILSGISSDPDDIWQDCQVMARRLIGDVKGERDPYWRQEARNLVTLHLTDLILEAPRGAARS